VTEQHHEDASAPIDDVDESVDETDLSAHESVDQMADESVDQTDPSDDDATAPGDARDPRIAAAVARLDTLGDRPPVEHVEVYEDVHRVLQESLADATHSTDRADGRPGGTQP
jgi:hypothetical protein